MVKPAYLWALCKTCRDSKWIGDICRRLGGQEVELDFGQRQVFEMIRMDSEWMDERIEERREQARQRKARERERKAAENAASHKVTRDKRDNTASRKVTQSHANVTPSVRPYNNKEQDSIKNNEKNINRSVAVRACAREDGNGDGNGDGLLIPGGNGSLMALALRFADAVRNDPDNGGGAFFDPAHDPVAMMVALTGDAKSVRRWRQLAAGIPDADIRQELFTAYREIACGEEPKNRAAALNARLGAMLPASGANGGAR